MEKESDDRLTKVETPTWAWMVGVGLMVIFSLLGYIVKSSDAANELDRISIEHLKTQEQSHEIALVVLQRNIDSIQAQQLLNTGTIKATSPATSMTSVRSTRQRCSIG